MCVCIKLLHWRACVYKDVALGVYMYKAVALGVYVCVLSCCPWCVHKVVALGVGYKTVALGMYLCVKLLPWLVCVLRCCPRCVCVYKDVALDVCVYV